MGVPTKRMQAIASCSDTRVGRAVCRCGTAVHRPTGAGNGALRDIVRWSEQMHVASQENSLGLSVGLTWI